jgi:hypothetical protein
MPKPERLASGHYKVRFRHGMNKAGDGLRETSETFPTKKAADEFAKWLDEVLDSPLCEGGVCTHDD